LKYEGNHTWTPEEIDHILNVILGASKRGVDYPVLSMSMSNELAGDTTYNNLRLELQNGLYYYSAAFSDQVIALFNVDLGTDPTNLFTLTYSTSSTSYTTMLSSYSSVTYPYKRLSGVNSASLNSTMTFPTGTYWSGNIVYTPWAKTLWNTALNGYATLSIFEVTITISKTVLANYDVVTSDGLNTTKYDFETQWVRLLAVLMGLTSNVDSFNSGSGGLDVTAWDLCRFSSSTPTSFSTDTRQYVKGSSQYFWTGNSTDSTVQMESGTTYSAGGWLYSSSKVGMMDPSFGLGEWAGISKYDILALSAVGWTAVSKPTPVIDYFV